MKVVLFSATAEVPYWLLLNKWELQRGEEENILFIRWADCASPTELISFYYSLQSYFLFHLLHYSSVYNSGEFTVFSRVLGAIFVARKDDESASQKLPKNHQEVSTIKINPKQVIALLIRFFIPFFFYIFHPKLYSLEDSYMYAKVIHHEGV